MIADIRDEDMPRRRARFTHSESLRTLTRQRNAKPRRYTISGNGSRASAGTFPPDPACGATVARATRERLVADTLGDGRSGPSACFKFRYFVQCAPDAAGHAVARGDQSHRTCESTGSIVLQEASERVIARFTVPV